MPNQVLVTLINDKTGVSVQLIQIGNIGYTVATKEPGETEHHRYRAYVERHIAVALVEELTGKKVPEY